LLIFAVALGVIGILLSLPRGSREVQLEVIVAAEDIDTYTVIDEGMVERRMMPATRAADTYGPSTVSDPKLMTTRPIRKGDTISRSNALPLDTFRPGFPLETISFPATVDKMVSGQVVSGHRINIYGYRPEQGNRPGELIMIAPRVWVVDVRTAQGEESRAAVARTPTPVGGGSILPGISLTQAPASIVTVATERQIVLEIIEALGQQGLSAWVTLAPDVVQPPPRPSLSTGTPVCGEFTLRWKPSPRTTTYILEEAGNSAFQGATIAYSGPATSMTLQRKAGDSFYRVRATNIVDKSDWSNTISVTVQTPAPPVLETIRNPEGRGNYPLKWNPVECAKGYVVQEAIDEGFKVAAEVYSGTATTTAISGRTYGSYCYRVKAITEVGDTDWSKAECTGIPTPTPTVTPTSIVTPTPTPTPTRTRVPDCLEISKLSDGPRLDLLQTGMQFWYLLVRVEDTQGVTRTLEDQGIQIEYCDPCGKAVYKEGETWRVKHEPGKEGYVEFPLAKGDYKVTISIISKIPLCHPEQLSIRVTLNEQNPIWGVVLREEWRFAW